MHELIATAELGKYQSSLDDVQSVFTQTRIP